MSKPQSKDFPKLHLLGFLLVFLSLTLLVIYQLVVGSDHLRIPLRQFIKPATFIKVIKGLSYQPKASGTPEVFPPSDLTIKVDCQEFCQFRLINAPDQSLVKTIPAIIDTDAAGQLKALELKFFDPHYGFIGYQNISLEDPKFYVINFNPDLLQAIQLKLNRTIDIGFIDYYPDSQQILFESFDPQTQTKQQFLYSANKPSLKIL